MDNSEYKGKQEGIELLRYRMKRNDPSYRWERWEHLTSGLANIANTLFVVGLISLPIVGIYSISRNHSELNKTNSVLEQKAISSLTQGDTNSLEAANILTPKYSK